MTDREEFAKWFKAEWNTDYYPTEAMYLAWQARGELDAVRIEILKNNNEALKADKEKLIKHTDLLNSDIAELTAKLAEVRDGDCCTEGCIKCDARKVLAETQEPVLYIDEGGLDGHATWAQAIRCQDTDIALYTTPPSREWQSLSDEEMSEIFASIGWVEKDNNLKDLGFYDHARAIEAKLMELNDV